MSTNKQEEENLSLCRFCVELLHSLSCLCHLLFQGPVKLVIKPQGAHFSPKGHRDHKHNQCRMPISDASPSVLQLQEEAEPLRCDNPKGDNPQVQMFSAHPVALQPAETPRPSNGKIPPVLASSFLVVRSRRRANGCLEFTAGATVGSN